jgi:hypothetical protein
VALLTVLAMVVQELATNSIYGAMPSLEPSGGHSSSSGKHMSWPFGGTR